MKNLLSLFCFFIPFILSISCTKEEPLAIELPSLGSYMSTVEGINKIDSLVENNDFYELKEDLEIIDPVNDMVWNYNILLPKNYSVGTAYPVLYLLHGKSSVYSIWKSLAIKRIIEYYASEGMPEILVVMPDAGDTYYVDGYFENIKYESFFINHFIPFIEQEYNIDKSTNKHLIGGFSMGGYGALYYSLKYPSMFSLCYAMSSPVDGNNNDFTPSPLKYLPNIETEGLPYLILDVGNNDRFATVNLEAHLALTYLSIPHKFILREGEHEAKFWKESLFILFDHIQTMLSQGSPHSY